MGHCNSPACVSREGELRVAREGVDANSTLASDRARRVTAAGNSKPSGSTRAVLLFAVTFYRIFLSVFFGGSCKFYPSCSVYAQEAISIHGARRGSWLALKRLLRCRPFTKGGFDPVPQADEFEYRPAMQTKESAR